MNRKNKVIGISLFLIMIILLLLMNFVGKTYSCFENNQKDIQQSEYDRQTIFLNSTIRNQQNNILSTIKQSWEKYNETNKDSLILKDKDGYVIYSNGVNNINFDASKMYKDQVKDSTHFNLYDNNHNLIAEEVSPQWNKDNLKKVLDTLVSPIKVFGNRGGMIVFDSNSGELFLDTTPNHRTEMHKDYCIFDDSKYAMNKESVQKTIDCYFKSKKDSNTIHSIVYMYNDATDMNIYDTDFEKYPLGDYDRQFIEMSVLPFETIGFEGQPLQLTVLCIANEKDIYSSYQKVNDTLNEAINDNKKIYNNIALGLFIGVIIVIISMITSLYVLHRKKDE